MCYSPEEIRTATKQPNVACEIIDANTGVWTGSRKSDAGSRSLAMVSLMSAGRTGKSKLAA